MSFIHSYSRSSVVFILLSAVIGAASAAGGTVRFSGAIVEPACSVNRSTLTMAESMRPASRDNELRGDMQLSVHCNTTQSVQILFDEADNSNGQHSFSASNGAEVLLSHANQAIRPGDSLSYTFAGKQETAVALATSLRKGSNAEATVMRSNILVSFIYR